MRNNIQQLLKLFEKIFCHRYLKKKHNNKHEKSRTQIMKTLFNIRFLSSH